ncbi:MAG: hypothetical protein IJ811_03820 [Clostridia bacterium]|nr:hypothetical protein [Clostridia bacterium]
MKKIITSLLAFILSISSVFVLTSCAAIKGMEEEFNVVFIHEGKIVASDTVTQFKNTLTPEIDEAYIPDGYKFFGWTAYSMNEIDPASPEFKTTFIGGGKMLHYRDVKGHESNRTVVMNALILDKNAVPKEYHYVVIAWYDKTTTSGMSQSQIDTMQTKLTQYLKSNGVSDGDIATIVVRGYTGNVGQSCGQIMSDDDVDIMLGWGSADNVVETGGMKETSLLESVSISFTYNGATKTRHVHRLTDTPASLLVTQWLTSAECVEIFNS